jgi:hypothetical protein
MTQIGLYKALLLILWGPEERVGAGYKWKQSILIGAITMTAYLPILWMQVSAPYRGAVPPAVPLIKGIGHFHFTEKQSGAKKILHTEVAIDGKTAYLVQDGSYLQSNPKRQYEIFYVEGFLLNDGAGLFWPSYVETMDGKVLRSREYASQALTDHRKAVGQTLIWMCGFVLIFWIVSIRNALRLCK